MDKKIVHVFWGLGYGGIETMLVNIANNQVKMGVDVHIIIINEIYKKALLESFSPKVKIHLLKRRPHSLSMKFIHDFNNLLDDINPNYIHLHQSKLYFFLNKKNKRRGVCSTLHAMPQGVIRYKGDFLFKLWPILYLRIKNLSYAIDRVPTAFSISKVVHDELKNKYGVESIVIENGILTTTFLQRPQNMPIDDLRMVQVSRLVHDTKGQDLLIRAVAATKGVTVDFIGEGESMDFLQQLATELGINDRVRFLGSKSQDYIREHLKDYDLFVQPSRYEGFGNTVAEAMAARVPVLVSEGQGPAEITCGDNFGWTFRNSDADDLASKIKYICEHYDEALAKVSPAYKHVNENYDVSVTARKYLENYGTITNKKSTYSSFF